MVTKAKPGVTFGALVSAIREAEYNSIKEIGGKGGQVWLDPKAGKVWATDFAPGDRYLKTEKEKIAEKSVDDDGKGKKKKLSIRVKLWDRAAHNLEDIFDEIPERFTPEWDRFLSMYLKGVYPLKFDPVAVAKKICDDQGI